MSRPTDTASTASPSSGFHIDSLDGIRACAALLVFFSHTGFAAIVPGGFGVTVFFFLSGYLITTLLRKEFQDTGDISLRQFYLRRVYRILPPLYIVLVLLMLPVVGGSFPNSITAGALAAQFFQFTNYYLYFNGTEHLIFGSGPTWSLAVEEHFYLVFPLLLRWLMRRMNPIRVAQVLMGVCVLILAWRFVLVFALHISRHYVNCDYTYLATDARVDSLLYGCIMGLCLNPVMDSRTLEIPRRLWIVLLLLSAPLLVASFLYREEWARDTLRYSIQGVALTPLFFCAIRFNRWPIFRWLNWQWVRGLGIISYTFYLIHPKAIQIADRYFTAETWINRSVALALAIAFSTLMYFLVEKKFAKLRRKLHSPFAVARRPIVQESAKPAN